MRVNSRPTKQLLLIPLLGLGASAAQAQVSLSGYLDIGVFRDFDKVKRVGTIQRSNIAFSGTEDLGGGLKASFRLSHRLDLDTGTPEGVGSKPFWHDEATVGLKNELGQLRLGRALDVIHGNAWAFDPWYNYNRVASPAWQFWHWNYATDRVSNNGRPEYGRLNDGIFFDSAAMGGFKLHATYSPEKAASAAGGNGRPIGIALDFNQGGWSALLARARNRAGDTDLFLGLKYSAGAFSVMGAHDESTYRGPPDSKAKVNTVAATYANGPYTWKAGFGQLRVGGQTSRFLGLGGDYAMSKRTTVYLSLGNLDPAATRKQSAFGLGAAHSF